MDNVTVNSMQIDCITFNLQNNIDDVFIHILFNTRKIFRHYLFLEGKQTINIGYLYVYTMDFSSAVFIAIHNAYSIDEKPLEYNDHDETLGK